MSKIDPARLHRHLADYEKVTGQATDRFICPITLEPCDDSSLIEGHILNKSFREASRRTVIQNSEVDNFYGTRVEPSLIRFMNKAAATPAELIRASEGLKVTLEDGQIVDAFVATGRNAKAARKRFAEVELIKGGVSGGPIFIKLPPDDPRVVGGHLKVEGVETFMPSHWQAAMVKAGYLATFDMLGYAAVFTPWSLYVRGVLNRYFKDRGSAKGAPRYFAPFRNAVRFILDPDKSPMPLDIDTLNTRDVLFHMTMADTMFAVTYLFKINGITVAVTLPESLFPKDVVVVHDYYEKLMADSVSLSSKVYRGRFNVDHWEVSKTPMNVTYMETPAGAPAPLNELHRLG